MNALKIKKGPVLLPLAVLVVALAAYTVLNFRGVSAAGSLSLGQQYLNEMDYGGAVAAFTRAIELDPTSKEARLGLARAYIGSENDDFARDMLEDMVYTQQPDVDAVLELIELLRRAGQLAQAVELSQILIDATDDDTYYTLQEELLAELAARPRSLAVGTDQSLVIQNGQVLSRGSNTLGQLGTDPAAVTASEQYASAQYAGGTPVKVTCVGRTSFVVDADGALWAAGENRWGQMGEGYAITAPQGGWVQVPAPGAVADVAGTTGRLLVLLTDGSLWTVGARSGQELERVTRFPVVVSLASSQQYAAVLTADGDLYRSSSQTPEQWELAARDVSSFTISGSELYWVTKGNQLSSSGGYVASAPDSWYDDMGNLVPEFYVHEMAQLNGVCLLTDGDGTLYRLPGDGTVEEVSTPAAVTGLYVQGGTLVLELEDGTAQTWNEETGRLQALTV